MNQPAHSDDLRPAPLKVLIMVAHAAGRGRRRGAGGPEVRTLGTLGFWDRGRVLPLVAYSRQGQLIDLAESAEAHYDISFTGGALAANFGRLVRALKSSGAAVVHSYGPVAADFLTVAACQRAGVPAVVTRPVIIDDLKQASPVRGLLRRLDRYTKRQAARIIAISAHGAAALLAEGCDPAKLVTIYNGVDTHRFNPQAAPNPELSAWAGDSFLLVMAAQMTPVKRHDLLLEALAMARDKGRNWRAVLAGDGPRRAELMRTAQDLDLGERVRFAGFVADTPALYAAAHAVVLPSDREGFPMTLLEAMAAGRAVAASDAGGTAELIEGAGLLLTDNTAEELYQALCRLEEPTLRRNLAEAGRAKALARYTTERMIHNLEDLYLEVAREAGR